MNPPGLVEQQRADLADPVDPVDLTRSDRHAGAARADLVHRHLLARLQAARRELEEIEADPELPEELVRWLGSVVTDRRREVDAARAAIEARAAAVVQAADRRATEMLDAAEAEARILRSVATWLHGVPLTTAAIGSTDAVAVSAVETGPCVR